MLTAGISACKHKTPDPQPVAVSAHRFPDDVGNIFITRCATAGCHNAQSYTNAADLLLDSWENLLLSGENGAVVVPYSPEYSSLLYFINTHKDLGPVAEPTMPLDNTPLTREEYLLIRNWIANGAPNKDGHIPFATDAATRQKVYITQQGCDLVAVIDAEKKVVMRYIPVGKAYTTENPNYIAMSPDGQYAYVCFWNGNYIQKIDTRTDKVVGETDMGHAYQKTLLVAADGSRLAVTSWYSQDLTIINTTTMQQEYILGNSSLESPESIMANASFDTFYVSSLFGNSLYQLAKNFSKTISIDNAAPTTLAGAATPDPYRIAASPDGSMYFVTCQNTNELRIMNAKTNELLATIPTGKMPQEIAVCRSLPLLFITCPGDTNTTASVGSVSVINYQTKQHVRTIEGKLFQPYGIAVDEQRKQFFIANRNQASRGPRPHHQSPCNGRNGYYMAYDLNTFEPLSTSRYEVSVDPYAAAIRFR